MAAVKREVRQACRCTWKGSVHAYIYNSIYIYTQYTRIYYIYNIMPESASAGFHVFCVLSMNEFYNFLTEVPFPAACRGAKKVRVWGGAAKGALSAVVVHGWAGDGSSPLPEAHVLLAFGCGSRFSAGRTFDQWRVEGRFCADTCCSFCRPGPFRNYR